MQKLVRLLVGAVALSSLCAGAQDAGPKRQEFTPKAGNGRVVVVISGQTGMANYTATAQQIADAGFDVVLVDGNDFWIRDTKAAWTMLKDVITKAQAGPHAVAGKVGVVGYSLGGGSALSYAARMPDVVATVVVAYPLTSFINDPADFVARMKVPVQMYAGTDDTYKNCCMIDMARRLAEAAKVTSPPILTLHEYNGVGHGFNLPNAARKDIAAGQDAMERTIAELKRALPAEGSK
ncbi:MAG: dienelactone hydrolase family protein [Burkholderiales bacterium]